MFRNESFLSESGCVSRLYPPRQPQEPIPRPLLCRVVPVSSVLTPDTESVVPVSGRERPPAALLERADTKAFRDHGMTPEWFTAHNATGDTAEARGLGGCVVLCVVLCLCCVLRACAPPVSVVCNALFCGRMGGA